MTPKQAIRRYLRTGQHDDLLFGWPGDNVVESSQNGETALSDALVAEVQRRASGKRPTHDPLDLDLASFTRRKIGPMIRGLFPRVEQETVLAALERSVVFLTPDRIEEILRGQRAWPHSAWDLANIYLGSLGLKLLGFTAPHVVGMSEERTCYVSMEYFVHKHRFADFVVHEVAHVFHNCKRGTIGLPETRTKEWLLDIEFRKRETFAYACEAYSRILELGATAAARRALLVELEAGPLHNDDTVSADEHLDILREAVAARNGWKRILARCAPARPTRPPRLPPGR